MNSEELNFANPLEHHYKNTELNRFDNEAINLTELKENNNRLKLRLSSKLRKDGIYNIMRKFGIVTSIHIPKESRNTSNSRMNVFVEYMTFREAEKALRELNNCSNSGLDIQVEFARTKQTFQQNNEHADQAQDCDDTNNNHEKSQKSLKTEEKKVAVHMPITVKFQEYFSDDVFEKVTRFEYSKPLTKQISLKHQEELKKLALKSKGTYDEKNNCFEYNTILREHSFVTFYCYNCENEATLRCDRSKKYYCSVKCHEKSNTVEVNSDVQQELEIKKSDKVCLTAIINEKTVYIRQQNEDLNHFLEKVQRLCKNAAALTMMPEIGDVVLAKLFDDIYRAKVLKIIEQEENEDEDDNVEIRIIVLLLDVGNTAKIKPENLFEITQECMDLNYITKKVILKDVNIEALHSDIINYLLSLLQQGTELVITDITRDGIELRDNTENTIINEKIMKMANFEYISMKTAVSVEMPNDLQKCGRKQKLFILNSSYLEQICCIRDKYLKDFYEFYKSLNAYGRTVDPNTYGILNEENLCLAKLNGQWHRVFVTKCKGDGQPECVLVDLQHMALIDIKNIFPLPQIFSEAPFLSEIFKVHGYSSRNENEKQLWKKLLAENNFITTDNIDFSNDDYILHLKNCCDCFLEK